MRLIDKDVIITEIENLENTYKKCPTRSSYEEGLKNGRLIGYKDALHKINTLEVKEVDLEHEVESYWKQCDMTWCRDAYSMTHIRSMLSDIAKHFFELGLKAQKGEEV